MRNQDSHLKDVEDLRQKAEALARKRAVRTPEDSAALSPEEIRKTLHELRVHQIELEMQSEGLRKAQAQIKAGRARYFDLYDLAPVGYCTLSKQGLIIEANLTAAILLGTTRDLLVEEPISHFILEEDQDNHYLHRKKLFETGEPQECELRLVKTDGASFWAHLTATAAQADDGAAVCRCVISDITERKQAEDALRESELRFRTLADSGQAMVWTSGLDKQCDYFNQPWLDFTGRTLAQEEGDGWMESVHPDDLARCVETYVGAFDPRERFSMDYRLRRHDGEFRWMQDDGSPRHDSRGVFLGFIGHCLDITERKQAEDKLRDSELFFHTTINSLKGHICVLDETGKIVLTNQAWDDFAIANSADPQCVSEGVNYLSVCDSVTGPDLESASSCSSGIRAVLSGDSPEFSMEYPCHSPTEKRWFFGKASPLQRKNSRWVVINHENITERKRAEEALRHNEARLNAILSSMNDIVFEIDLNGYFEGYHAPAYKRLYVQPDYFLGKKFDEVLPEDVCALLRQAIESINTGNSYQQFEYHLTIDNKIQWEQAVVTPRHNTLNEIIGITAVCRDITEHKRAEEERVSLQAQLTQAQKLESVGRLAGGIAHDFNNMLSIILGYGEILFDRLHPGDPMQDDVKEIVEAGKRSAALTRQLLAFSRKQTLEPEVLDLNAVICTAEKMLSRLIGEDIELELSLSDEIDRVTADPGQIEQVIMNLSVNARDAMPRGGKLILETANAALDETYAKSHASVQPGNYVMLAVTDTGCGMDKETLTKIFEPFFTTKEMGKGTGLGLATVYGIVKQSGGNIWVYSEPGRGTTFKIYLPQTLAEQEPKTGVVEKETPKGGGEHILVVEDEDSLRKLTETSLSRLATR